MWNATLISLKDNNTTAVVVFDNTKTKERRELPVTPDFISVVRNIAKQLSNRDTELLSLAPGPLDLSVPEPPTPEIDHSNDARNQFYSDLSKYQQIQNLVTLGIVNSNAKEIATLKSTLQNEYNFTYL